MTKRVTAKTGEYQKDGETKGEYTKLGVVLSNDNGEYMLLDPAISLAGILVKQNALAMKQNKPVRESVMVSFFEEDNQQQQPRQAQQQAPQQGGYQQQAPQQQPQQQGGYQQPQPQHFNQQGQ